MLKFPGYFHGHFIPKGQVRTGACGHYTCTSTNPPNHIFLDEAPMEVKGRKVDIPATVASLTSIVSLLPPTSFIWTVFDTDQVRDAIDGSG